MSGGGPLSLPPPPNALFPCVIKINTVDLRQDIHGNRLAAHSEKFAALPEIFGSEPFRWRAEFRQSLIDCLRVVGVGLNQKVNIFGGARLRVERYGVAPHDKVQRGQQRGLLRARNHRGGPRRHGSSLRTLPQRRARRVAGYRSRSPQRRQTRTGHPVRLPALRKARRGDDGQRHHVPRALRRARGGQGAGLRSHQPGKAQHPGAGLGMERSQGHHRAPVSPAPG